VKLAIVPFSFYIVGVVYLSMFMFCKTCNVFLVEVVSQGGGSDKFLVYEECGRYFFFFFKLSLVCWNSKCDVAEIMEKNSLKVMNKR